MKVSRLDILIVNCNTSILTNIAIASIFRKIKSFEYDIYVFDNSYSDKFQLDSDNLQHADKIHIIDNYQEKLLDFQAEYNAAKKTSFEKEVFEKTNQGSFKHSLTIQYFIDHYAHDSLLLLDSDIILKKDVDFCDDDYITAAEIEFNPLGAEHPGEVEIRFRPFIEYFNVKQMKSLNIKYFNPKIDPDWGRDPNVMKSLQYDTGTAFFLRCLQAKRISIRNISHSDYIHHLFCGTRQFSTRDIDSWIRLALSEK